MDRLLVSLERAVECRFASNPPPHKTPHDASIVRTNRPNQDRHRRQGASRAASRPARRPSAAASRLGARPDGPRRLTVPPPDDPPAAPHAERTPTIDRGGGSARVPRGYFSASPPRRSSSHSSPRAVVSPETGANRRYKFRRVSASSDQDDEDGDEADLGDDARRDEHDERHAGFAVSPSRLHSRRGGGGIGTPNQRTRRSSGGSHASLTEEAARISAARMGGSGRWSRDGTGDRHSAGSASPMSPAMPQR